MPATIDKFLGRPLNHKHQISDIIGYTNSSSSQSVTVTSNSTAGAEDIILVDATNNPVTITLPQASTATSKIYKIKKIDSSLNPITVDGYAAETIDGDQTIIICYQNSSIQLASNSTSWYIV